ncbi:tetratricopeptide repeat-containing protein [Falsiroseomonas sp. HC035]|uniref:tetratricopeptide repeat-containing protein n=1 Tax=Falsiroseomonas sp. HC035 TaxID=3390999 RepID=UPI003D3120E0
MQRAFVIRPFGTKTDTKGKAVDFEAIHSALIAPALAATGLGGGTTGEIVEAGNIREDMFALIIEADIVVCDITVHNANVFYELGIRHALRKKRSVLIKGGPVADATPFDILTDRYLAYEVDDPGRAAGKLAEVIRATLADDRATDSPVFKMLPALPEVDPTSVQIVPQDLAEEVARAAAARSPGWLRLLASEVAGRRFQWPALRLIGQAQWDAGDYEGARRSWEQVRANDPDDLAANLAMANLFERQYKAGQRPESLEASNHAIARVLTNGRASTEQRAEALALEGRNTKTLWRLDFEKLPDLAARRERATNRRLLKAYEAYRAAYLVDLNHTWSGLAALQMGIVAQELAREPSWEDAFDDAAQAAAYRSELDRQVESLRAVARLVVQAALGRLPRGHKDRVWAEISRADLAFLNGESAQKVAKAYLDALPRSNFFAWNAARTQLELFATLGIRAEIATEVIRAVDPEIRRPEPDPALHMVVFAGHRVDEPGRAEPRFTPAMEAQVRALIRDGLSRRQTDGTRLHVLASGAPGSDVMCHELCQELGIASTMCLPMPPDDFGRLAFGRLDDWRSRFLRLLDAAAPLQLGDREGLPRWLQGSGLDPWERGNRWVLEMARSAGARKVTLVALWDGKPTGAALGGTAHMLELARNAGTIDVVVLDLPLP